MNLLNSVKSWLDSELPTQEEIKDQINRLASNRGMNQSPADKLEFTAAIELLKKELGGSTDNESNAFFVTGNSKKGEAAFPSKAQATSLADIKDAVKAKTQKANGSRAASPIKDKGDIKAIARMMVKWGYQREAHLLIIGCNTALRYSDLRLMKFEDISRSAKEDGTGYIEQLIEQKTGKAKRLTLNKTAMNYITKQYELLQSKGVDTPVYVFQGTGNRTKATPKPVSRSHVNNVFKYVRESMDLNFRLSTHSLRKSFSFHAYDNGNGIDIKVIQKLLNHASEDETFNYIGINAERVQQTYIDAEIEVEL